MSPAEQDEPQSAPHRVFRGIVVVEVYAFADADTPSDKLPFDVSARLADDLQDLSGGNEHVYIEAKYPTLLQEFTELREVES